MLLCKINVFDIFKYAGWYFSNFCYIANYWNSDRIKLLGGKCMCKASLIDVQRREKGEEEEGGRREYATTTTMRRGYAAVSILASWHPKYRDVTNIYLECLSERARERERELSLHPLRLISSLLSLRKNSLSSSVARTDRSLIYTRCLKLVRSYRSDGESYRCKRCICMRWNLHRSGIYLVLDIYRPVQHYLSRYIWVAAVSEISSGPPRALCVPFRKLLAPRIYLTGLKLLPGERIATGEFRYAPE